MQVTFEQIRQSPEIRTYIKQADASLLALGFTEHSFAHVTRCAETASGLLSHCLLYTSPTIVPSSAGTASCRTSFACHIRC